MIAALSVVIANTPVQTIYVIREIVELRRFRFPNTGLARLRDGAWVVGDDGRTDERDTNFRPALEIVGADSSPTRRIEVRDIVPIPSSLQGVTVNPVTDEIWFATTGLPALVGITPDGRQSRTIAIAFMPNGLAYDSREDALVVGRASTEYRNKEVVWISLIDGRQTRRLRLPRPPDHLAVDGRLLWVTFGANRTPGQIRAVDIDTGTVVAAFSIPAADAIEGIVVGRDSIYLNNDAEFHRGSPPINRLISLRKPALR